ncbi:Leucoanthocyanidin reductase [Anopheles sinensis]|uniref:Leucoanthocyanidin reductase n=1 Tax=Anopheles sinensis TaxID=74873 RepID=A0A084VKN4_ANOSI|nr:Leucoanthocyanidin reductase [Anopheles sinensis]
MTPDRGDDSRPTVCLLGGLRSHSDSSADAAEQWLLQTRYHLKRTAQRPDSTDAEDNRHRKIQQKGIRNALVQSRWTAREIMNYNGVYCRGE